MNITTRRIARNITAKQAKHVGKDGYNRDLYRHVAEIIEVPALAVAIRQSKAGKEYIEVPASLVLPQVVAILGAGLTATQAQDKHYGDAAAEMAQAAYHLRCIDGYGQPYDGKRRAYLSRATAEKDLAANPGLGECLGDWVDHSHVTSGKFEVVA